MNKVILMGRLTADPELRQTPSGISNCRFTVAVDRKFTDKNTGERQTDFITCVAWKRTAEFIAKYFSKGKMIVIEGSLRTGSYQDKNHPDVTHYTSDVYVDDVGFCGDKGNSTAPATQQAQPQAAPAETYGNLSEFEEIISGGDVPF